MSERVRRRFSVAEYYKLIPAGILKEGDPIELLEGELIEKMPQYPPHATAIDLIAEQLLQLPKGWYKREQKPITLAESAPEPDLAIVRGSRRDYATRHPGPDDIRLLIEVADSSLANDRSDKVRIYARAGIIEYWIVNLVDSRVEVYTQPSGSVANPHYASRIEYLHGSSISLSFDGNIAISLMVDEMLP